MSITSLKACPTSTNVPPTTPIQSLTYTPTGYPLVHSNWPETIDNSSINCTLQKATGVNSSGTPLVGSFRVFFHHYNGYSSPVTVGIGVRAPSTASSTVEVDMLKATPFNTGASDPSGDAATAGAVAFITYLASGSSGQVASLSPGQFTVISPTAVSVPVGSTVAGYFDFHAWYPNGAGDAPIEIYVMNWTGSTPTSPLAAYTTPPSSATGPVRGVFPPRTRPVPLTLDASTSPFQYIGAYPRGTWYQQACCSQGGVINNGDYEQGWNEINSASVYDNGNYGVDYQYTFQFYNSSSVDKTLNFTVYNNIAYPCINNCLGQTWCTTNSFPLKIDFASGFCEFAWNTSWNFATLTIPGNTPSSSPVVTNLTNTLAGGSCAPVTLWIG